MDALNDENDPLTPAHRAERDDLPDRTGRARSALVALVTAVVVVTVGSVFALATMFPGLRFTPQTPQRQAPPAAAPVKPVASFTPAADSPAARVVRSMVKHVPGGLPAGVRDASSVSGTVSPALNLTCGQPVGPVVSQQRSWALPAGPMGSGITVTVSAYSAGAGAAAMDAMRRATSECAKGASISPREAVGVEAVDVLDRVGARLVRSVVFRRGDVLVSVSGAGAEISSGLLADLDTTLDDLLSAPGVCADQNADVAQFARSLVSGPTFHGLTQSRSVGLPTSTPSVSLPPLVAPSSPVPLPDPVTATTPAEPYWPASAPAPVPSPVMPTVPAPYPTQTAVSVPQRDVTGPGCGWAFTGMAAPAFDEAAAKRTTDERVAAAVAAMRAAVGAYNGQVQAYGAAWDQYQRQAADYAETNARIAEVEQAWAIIRQQQDAYSQALAQYQQQLVDYQTFAQRQQAAVLAYQQALADCAAVPAPAPGTSGGTLPPVPSPTASSPVPGPSGSTASGTTPASTPGTSGTPGAAPGAPAPFAAAPQSCPPIPDPIITEAPPTSPYSPLPPPDPRPTPGGTQ